MLHENYIQHVLSFLSSQAREDLQARLEHLDSILERINGVPSPEKESLLIELILEGREHPTQFDIRQSAA